MICLSDLPTGALAHVSSFLAAPSCALFAVALACREVERSSSIIGCRWVALDFGDIEKDLAAKLSDQDIRDVLLSIDAVNNLKKLSLNNCILLRESIIIEQIDLSLVGDHESPYLDSEESLSCAEVIPILDSIIVREECVLKHLQFPLEWCRVEFTESDFHAFLARYNDYLSSEEVVCFPCNSNIDEDDSMPMMQMSDYYYGRQNYTCCQCMKHYCHDCVQTEDEDEIYWMSSICNKCERRYCMDCSLERDCPCCDEWFCEDCLETKQCPQCEENFCLHCISETRRCHNNSCEGKIWCDSCINQHGMFRWCEDCNESYCGDCCNSDFLYGVQGCVDCGLSLCKECRETTCREGARNCTGCYHMALLLALEERERLSQQLHEEMHKQLISELNCKVECLTVESEEA